MADVTRSAHQWTLDLLKEVGLPGALLFLLLFGVYKLFEPLVGVAIHGIERQTELIKDISENMEKQTLSIHTTEKLIHYMAADSKQTRLVVEKDASEDKLLLLREIKKALEEHNRRYSLCLKNEGAN